MTGLAPAAGATELDPWRDMGLGALGAPGPSFFHGGWNLAAIAAAALLLALLRRRPAAPERARPLLVLAALAGLAGALLGAGAGPSAGAAKGGILLWEASLALGLAAAVVARRGDRRPWRPELPVLIALAAAARLALLHAVPPRIHAEEAWIGLWCRFCAEGRVGPFGTGFYGNPLLHFCLDALALREGGAPLLLLRLSTVAQGLLAVAATYLIAEELFEGRLAPLAAGTFAAFHHVMLHYGRIGGHWGDPAPAAAVAVLAAVRALGSGGWPSAAAGGIATGILAQGYIGTRVAPLLGAGLLAGAALVRRGDPRREAARALAAFACGALLALGPLLAFYAAHPGALATRERDVVAFDPRLLASGDAESWRLLLANARRTLWLHTAGIDTDSHYHPALPYLSLLGISLVAAGALALVLRPRSRAAAVVLPWMALVLGLGSLAVRDPIWRRTIALLPALGLCAGAAVAAARRLPRAGPRLAAALALLVVLDALPQVDYALRRHGRLRPADLPSDVARRLASEPPGGAEIQLLTLPDLSTEDAHVRFCAPEAAARHVVRGSELRAGRTLVSLAHAPLLPALLALPGARLEPDLPIPAAWRAAAMAAPSAMDTRREPPLLLHLPSDPPAARGAVVSLRDEAGAVVEAYASPLPYFDYRRAAYPEVRRVTIAATLEIAEGDVTIGMLRRGATATFAVDGAPRRDGVPLSLAPGRHLVEAAFVPKLAMDVYVLTVTFSGRGACCTPPPLEPAPTPPTSRSFTVFGIDP